ncbi:MAG: SDR family oxidoreductase [Desulfovibrionaceae bacterium]
MESTPNKGARVPSDPPTSAPRALRVGVLGATGYVGGRLVPHLLQRGYAVRAMSRSQSKLDYRLWAGHPACETLAVDVFDRQALCAALRGLDVAYYLVHSMDPGQSDFAAADREAAANMAFASAQAGVRRIIYLSGLVPADPRMSKHLASRAEVADILSQGTVPVTVLRAAVILGSGSASFELIRYLVDRLPVMLTPRWVRTESQPICIRNVLHYLSGCLECEATVGQTYDIGGPFIETYERLFRIYEQEAGLRRRWIVPVPILTPMLSSMWLGLITPIPVPLARPLVLGLRNRVVCGDYRIRELIPQDLMDCRTAIRRALEKVSQNIVDTSWADAGQVRPPEWMACGDAPYAGGTVLDIAYRVRLSGCPEQIWDQITRIGGATGWYRGNVLWFVRGVFDRIIGGAGLARGRRHPTRLQVGDALDFWRVLDVSPPNRLLLLAEMKLPGEALLEFAMAQLGTGETELTMTARFLPRGLWGIVYWYAMGPAHTFIFKGVVRAIAQETGCRLTGGPERVRHPPVKCPLPQPANATDEGAAGCGAAASCGAAQPTGDDRGGAPEEP